RPFATAIPTLAAASSGEAATGLPKEPENPIAHRRGHVSQVRSPRFQHSVHLPPEFRAIARRSFASGSIAYPTGADIRAAGLSHGQPSMRLIPASPRRT